MMPQDRQRGARRDTRVYVHVPVQGGTEPWALQSCIGVAQAAPESKAAAKQVSLHPVLGPTHSSLSWLNRARLRNHRVAAPAAYPFSKADAEVINDHLSEVPNSRPCQAAGQAALGRYGRSWGELAGQGHGKLRDRAVLKLSTGANCAAPQEESSPFR